MLERFLEFFLMTSGITAGIIAILLPIVLIVSIIRYFGAYRILKKFRLESEHWINNKVDEERQEEPTNDGMGTPPFV